MAAAREGLASVYGFLLEQTGAYGKWALLFAVGAGLAHTVAIGTLAESIEVLLAPEQMPESLSTFLLAAGAFAVMLYAASHFAAGVGQRIAGAVALQVAEGAGRISLGELERIGRERILRAATIDANLIARNVETALDLLACAVCIVTIIALFVYYDAVVGLSVVATFLVVVPLLVRNAGRMRLAEARSVHAERRFVALAGHAIEGFRELRLNRRKHEALHDRYLLPAIERSGRANTAWSAMRSRHIRFIVVTWLIGLGIAGFAIPQLKPVQGLGAIAFLYTYMIRMLAVAAFSSVALVDGAAPIGRVRKLLAELATPEPAAVAADGPAAPFATLEARGVGYAHRDADGEESFRIGPVDFELRRGEVVFVTGANGSGKTTLIRTLTGLYAHDRGTVLINGVAAGPAELRRLFATVFTDYHLLNPLYGLPATDPARAQALLEIFGLAGKVGFDGQRFSTTDLSAGQRRRLALVAALLEDRPVLLLDEWAADQDPVFRRRFYDEILPACRARGQAVIAITHDDRYFDRCDRRYHLNMGQLSCAD